MEEHRRSNQKRVTNTDFGFTDIIFSWSIENIFNEDLYKNKVKKIELSFSSVLHYFTSYMYPLLEETRVRLSSSMEILSSAPFAEVTALVDAKPYRAGFYHVKVESWRNRFTDHGKEPYKTLPGDVLVLADGKPETVDDLQRVGRFWTFVSVSNITEDDNTSGYFKIKGPKDIDLDEVSKKSLYVIFLTNIAPSRRIWNYLHMSGSSELIEKILCTDGVVEESCDYCSAETGIVTDKYSSSNFNESQINAILACLSGIQCNHKPTVNLVWGPPGTGKTKTLSALLFSLMKMKCTVLVCTPTNVAIKEIASRVLSMVRESFESGSDALFCPLGDMLLFGNKERLKAGASIEDIYLDYRVKQLTECFAPVTGWRSCFASMIDLLEDCVSHYHVYVENKLAKKEEDLDKNRETRGMDNSILNKKKPKSFLVFLRERFISAKVPLRNCISILCTHVARSYILEHNYQNMVCLIEILDSIEALLFENDILHEGIEEFFSLLKVLENSALSFTGTAGKLYNKKTECVSVLKVLKESLGKLDLPTSYVRIKEFCFRSCSLMFSTAYSSYMLHSIKMQPPSILVIDEAAQLKECESVIPLLLQGVNHAILVGDDRQLPATVESNVSSDAGFGRSLFERLSTLGHSKHLLNIQYRMHPSISSFPNSYFYFNEIHDASNVKRKNYAKQYLPGPMFGTYSFLNVIGGREEFDNIGRSRKNMVEVAVVDKILKNLHKVWHGSNEKLSIGIISPYAAQLVAIQEKIGHKYDRLNGFDVNVKTIDGFQGGEQDIIILSTVRTNYHSSLEFISSPQRTNVALTRARYCLWILGDSKTLTSQEGVWKSLVHNAKNRQCFFNADEDKDLAKAILDVKKGLDQFDDMLNPDSAIFRNAKWKVLFSDNFLKSFKMLHSQHIKKSVISLLLRLSTGWRPKRRNIDSLRVGSSEILKQVKVEGLYVICGTDIEKESRYTQILKIWDVLPLEEIPKLVKLLDGIFGRFTDDFISRCMEKCLEGNLEVPMSWEKSTDIVQYKDIDDIHNEGNLNSRASDGRSYVENSKVGESLLLLKFYSLSSNIVSHLLSNRDTLELDLPFQGTDEETEIILYPRSTFVLGRSGTGKTTVLTMKLFQKEHKYHVTMDAIYGSKIASVPCLSEDKESKHHDPTYDRPVLCQLFVTVSPKLCHAVKYHVNRLTRSIFGGHGGSNSKENGSIDEDIDDSELKFKDIPDSFVDLPSNLYPLVVTFQKFLMMLDGTLGNSYFERFHDMSSPYGRILGLGSVSFETFMRKKEVDYDKFTSQYWPHFNSSSTKKLDSSKVFTEIITHIKGGEQVAEHSEGRLSREEYLNLPGKRTSSLNRQKREMIYDIYLNYEKMKMKNGEFDLADLVIDIHRRLRNNKYHGDEIHYVYIDEVQDLTMSQIALFKYICQNVEEGFVFSGDTAQTIARGIEFRFQDIRSLFYKKFVLESKSSKLNERKEKGQILDILQLTQNSRTHDGVLKLSQSVLELLFRFFPHFIDVLKPETSLIYGEAPVVLESGNCEDAIVTIFGNSGNMGGKIVGFGAEQVILVRDDCARNEISNYVGKHALVLTIWECKGLEFQDVLLYNFFGSSPLKNRWGVIYQFMNDQNLLDSIAPKSYPSFSDSKHNVLCSELKQLYVAITCTRQRLWICENNEEFSRPMFDYWIKKCLVQVKQLDDSFAQSIKVASSPEEWKSRGKKLYHQNNYEMAAMCFQRAGDTYWENKAKVAGLKATANRLLDLDPENSSKIIREAAVIYETIGMNDSAAQCYSDLGDYERAGKLYLGKCGEPDLKSAGECFFLAKCYEMAAEVFNRGSYFSNCLKVCEEGRLFDIGFDYIQHWKQSETGYGVVKVHELNVIEQKFLESCAVHYHKLNNTRSMLKAVKAFHSMDLKRKFLNSLGLLDELLMLEEEMGNFQEAATIAKQIGDVPCEADLLGKAGNFSEAAALVLSYVLANSLWCSGSEGWPFKKFSQKEELLRKAKLLGKKVSANLYELACTEADILSEEHSDISKIMALLSSSQGHSNAGGEIICLRKLLDVHFDSPKYSWLDELVFDSAEHMEGMILKSQLSVETLFYSWSCWKDKIVHILEYLPCFKTHDVYENQSYGLFAMNYLGVRKNISNLNDVFSLLIPDADWVTKIGNRNLKKKGRLVSIDVHAFVSASLSYWSSELFSVGTNVLRILETQYNFLVNRNFSKFCKSRTLMIVYTVSKFLLDFRLFNHSHENMIKLERFIRLPIDNIFDCVFPLDWRESLAENMVSLRATKVCHDMLREIIYEKIMQKGRLTYDQIGRTTVMIMGSGKPNNELCAQVRGRLHQFVFWNELFQAFHRKAVPKIPEGSEHFYLMEALRKLQLTKKFHEALTGTYSATWINEVDSISPHCFLYLIERLLIWISYPKGFIFTTKSHLLEWLMYQDDSALPNLSFMARAKPFEYIHDSIARVLSDLLNNNETIGWIRKSGINVNLYYPLLILRSVVALCLVHINSGKCLHILHDLMGRGHITGQLPWEFFDVLRKGKKFMSIQVFAEAFKKVDNPLVCMRLWNTSKEIICKEVIFLDLTINQDRKDVLQMLFPKSIETMHCQTANAVSKTIVSTSVVLSSTDGQCLLDLLETLKQALNNADQLRLPNDLQQSKDNVDKSIQLLNASMTGSSLDNIEDKKGLGEMMSMLDELNKLSAVLSDSNPTDESVSFISELSKKIMSRGEKVKHTLDQLFLRQKNIIDDCEALEASAAFACNDEENHLEKVKENSKDSQGPTHQKELKKANTACCLKSGTVAWDMGTVVPRISSKECLGIVMAPWGMVRLHYQNGRKQGHGERKVGLGILESLFERN
ncbi:hypothetical protein L6164_001230 [Bauhinia variegata]|uniref:Uncharacterized protein n=1 Tax=Bauhinia variegata TaxID=167791 RepID=A0ACB9Q8E7_BAUVA|nr:hypothetical protein L6164_001230 [Bauhinia variegata]